MAEQNGPQNLQQAATSPNVAGALQQLLLSRMPTPDQEYWQREGRQDTLEQYQSALRQPAQTGYTPTEHSLYTMINSFGPGTPTGYAALKGIAAGGMQLGKNAVIDRQGEIDATKVGYEDAKLDGKEDLLTLKALSTGARGTAKASAPIVKMDKDGNMVVHDPVTQETKVVHSSQASAYQNIWAKAYENASKEGMENPEQYAHGVASNVLGVSPNAVKPIQPAEAKPVGSVAPVIGAEQPSAKPQVATPPSAPIPQNQGPAVPQGNSQADRQVILQQEWERNAQQAEQYKGQPQSPQYQEALRNQALVRQEMLGAYKVDPARKAPTTQPAPTIAYRDKPAAALAESEAKGIGGARGKEYEAVQMAGAAAETQLQAFNTLEKIKPNTNAAANAQEHIAGLFNALGTDPNSPMIQNAIKNRESNQILDQLRNASLKAENGVQTKSDEDRIGREFPKTTDFSKAWDFGLKLGKERALRAQERLAYYDSNVAGTSNVGGARSSWNREYAGDPITQYLGGKLIFRNDFINGYARKYPDAGREGAIAEWRELEKDYQARGGKK